MILTRLLTMTLAAAALLAAGCGDNDNSGSDSSANPTPIPTATPGVVTAQAVVANYAALLYANYGDALAGAEALHEAVEAFVDAPSQATFDAAKAAWIASRPAYQQSEIGRFYNGPIDDPDTGPEGRINSWPLDENFIDYVEGAPASGLINDPVGFPVIDEDTIAAANQASGETDVSTGYHAIEFLLWGQDLNADGTPGFSGRDDTPGERPYTDYLPIDQGCTNGNCDRRGQYLLAATDLLIGDLEPIVAAWSPAAGNNYYASFVAGAKVSLANILEGMGRLGYGELAGERMNVALVANSQEDEHSCFSDNTNRDVLLDGLGIENSYLGTYTRVDGRVVSGPGIDDLLVAQNHADVADRLGAALADSVAKLGVIDQRAKAGVPFDNQIQDGIAEPNIVAAIEALKSQTDVIEDAIEALGVTTGDLRQDTGEF